MTKLIKKLVKNKHYNFLETLAEDVFDELFKDRRIDKILSAIGSKSSPSLDSSLNILASKPSKKSVKDATKKRIKGIKSP